jgi:hypothetical protein
MMMMQYYEIFFSYAKHQKDGTPPKIEFALAEMKFNAIISNHHISSP